MYKLTFSAFIICLQFILMTQAKADNKKTLINNLVNAHQSLNTVKIQPSNLPMSNLPTKTLRLKITQLSDSQGQKYIGAVVSSADLSVYLEQLKSILGDSFSVYRAHQAARDHYLFHMTLVSPPEYQLTDKTIINQLITSQGQLNVSLIGLGEVALDDRKTYFVVAQSNDAQLLRQKLLLKNKDLHITLGFNPSDIYGVTKDSSTLINK